VSSTSNAAADLTLGQLPPDQFQETTMNLSSDLLGNFPDGGFTFGIIKNNVAAFIRALEDVTDVTVLAHPKVVALNKQPAEVIVGRRDGYLTTTVTETAAIQTVEFLETGTQIQLVPLINADGTVRLDVRPKDSNGGLNASNLPFEETTEAHAQLLIEDGHTVLIGGLFRERTVSSTSQIPVLGDVPLAGALFRRQNDETVREEVIILLTVRVMDDPATEQADVIDMLEDIERIRVGSRRGLMGTGRERLAQAFYQRALIDWEAGHADRALFNVRMALHNHPRHLAAFKLKEELLQERLWASDGARIREFLFELLEDTPDAAKLSPDYGRPEIHQQLIRGEPLPAPAVEGEQ
jgi:type IV pilus assembly protein PilQ